MNEQAANNRTTVADSERIKTIGMLFDGALNFIKIAREKAEQGDSCGKNLYIGKTSAIVSELSSSLTMDKGAMAQSLKKLYDYIFNCMQQAKARDDVAAIEAAEEVFLVLKDTWTEIEFVNRL